jgi:hypothetical protein
MAEVSRYTLAQLPKAEVAISKVPPKNPPHLIEDWVVWEYTACLFTDGLRFTTESLHDVIKAHAVNQKLPVNVFYASNAAWILDGSWGRAKVDDDRRPRISMNLRDSRYGDMQFITGIDYFGDCWANVQMMMVIQPEELEKPPKPVIPKSLLPNEALVVLVVVAAALIFSGNSGLQILGLVGLVGGLIIWAISSQNVREAKDRYAKWEQQVKELVREEEEIKRNRLSRSFKTDDLFVFHEVMTKITSAVIFHNLIERGAKVEESNERNFIKKVIPQNTKDLFDDF